MKGRRSVRVLAHLRAGERLALDPLEEPQLAVGDHLIEAGLRRQLERRRGAGEPVMDRARRDDRRLQPEPGVPEPGPSRAEQGRLGAHQVEPLKEAAIDAGRDAPVGHRSTDAEHFHDVVDGDRPVAADEANKLAVRSHPAARARRLSRPAR